MNVLLFKDFKKIHPWIFNYFFATLKNLCCYKKTKPVHIFITICDHFEPLWQQASYNKGLRRIERWCQILPELVSKHKDADGCHPKYTFFYPIEEYQHEYLLSLAQLKKHGIGEVEVHLHHDKDNADNLRKTIIEFKNKLFFDYGLLCQNKQTNEIGYGFIHGNWALDNARKDGRWCGVNNELTILQDTGCYADFTLPSAPDHTQTMKINSIYNAIDNPNSAKSHNFGRNVQVGLKGSGLLCIQGPLILNWKNRKAGIFPRIENGHIGYDTPITKDRLKLWIQAAVHVIKQPNHIFIKLYTHGCQEQNMEFLLNGGLEMLFSTIEKEFNDGVNYIAHYVSAREMTNIVYSLIDGYDLGDIESAKNYRFAINSRNV